MKKKTVATKEMLDDESACTPTAPIPVPTIAYKGQVITWDGKCEGWFWKSLTGVDTVRSSEIRQVKKAIDRSQLPGFGFKALYRRYDKKLTPVTVLGPAKENHGRGGNSQFVSVRDIANKEGWRSGYVFDARASSLYAHTPENLKLHKEAERLDKESEKLKDKAASLRGKLKPCPQLKDRR